MCERLARLARPAVVRRGGWWKYSWNEDLMFERVDDYPVDPIMIGADLFARDDHPGKLDLTVGVFEDEHGETPVLPSVKAAERVLNETQPTKRYTALTGDPSYCEALGRAVFGAELHDDAGFASVQTAGGAVALRLMADLLAQMPEPRPTVWLQTPTYGNYIPILDAAKTPWSAVPYYDRASATTDVDAMLAGLEQARPGDLFLMQGVCHNPTGADLTDDEFDALLDLLEARGIIPWIDLAYLGFASSWDDDCAHARRIVERFPECIVCITLSKSFGIYRDRAGALWVKTAAEQRDRIQRALSAIVRSSTSHAPDHGPSVVRTILADDELRRQWLAELDAMRRRVAGIRDEIVAIDRDEFGSDLLSYFAVQRGMFSLLPLDDEQERALTQKHGIHVVKGGRVNAARLRGDDVRTLVAAVHDVVEKPVSA